MVSEEWYNEMEIMRFKQSKLHLEIANIADKLPLGF